MPVQYQGVIAEHHKVRTQVGLFDISHMGKFVLRGAHVRSQLSRLIPTDLTTLPVGQGQYTVLLNPQGGILDDVIVYYQGSHPQNTDWECCTVIVNAATLDKDRAWLQAHLQSIAFQDLSSTHLLLALQGPQALAKLQPWILDPLGDLKRFQHRQVKMHGGDAASIFIARTGYTGEDGFEIMLPPAAGEWLWQQLIADQVQPCGVGCRDTLRLEAAMHLYGQDMDETTSPLEASLAWLVNSSQDYTGQARILQERQQGVTRQLVGLQMLGREIPRSGYRIFHHDQPVGVITSGTKSPTLGSAIALGYVPPSLAAVGGQLSVEIRGKCYPAAVVKRPFYRSPAPAPR
jgi:aminomethyltransferase